MTQTRYLLWRLAQTFGIAMRQRHATNAAAEMHLLREAEEVLGRLAWEDAEQIEKLSVEYWSLRKLSKQYGDFPAGSTQPASTWRIHTTTGQNSWAPW